MKGCTVEELLKAFEMNHDLGDKAKAMWSEGASAREVADTLAEAGFNVGTEQVEQLLAMLQADRAEAIGDERVDRDQLKAVAGGTDCGSDYTNNNVPKGAHLGKCTQEYLTTECSATVENGSWCWSNDNCVAISERYSCVNWYK